MDTPTLVGTGFALLGLVVWIFCAYICYQQAPRFGRRPVPWLVLGIVFGPIALMILYILPKSQPQHSTHKKTDPRADLYEVPHKKKG